MISRSIDIAEYGINPFFFIAVQYSIVYLHYVSFTQNVLYNTSVHKCLGCLRALVTVNEMNIGVHYAKKLCCCCCCYFGYIPRSEITRLYTFFILSF